MLKSPGGTRAMGQDLALGHKVLSDFEEECNVLISILCELYAVAEGVPGILPAFTSAGSFTLGLFISSSVTPASIFVSPITGGSPFFTNSYSPCPNISMNHQLRMARKIFIIVPGNLFPASLIASLTTCS